MGIFYFDPLPVDMLLEASHPKLKYLFKKHKHKPRLFGGIEMFLEAWSSVLQLTARIIRTIKAKEKLGKPSP